MNCNNCKNKNRCKLEGFEDLCPEVAEEVVYYDKDNKPRILVKMHRFKGNTSTVGTVRPLVCREFCEKSLSCKLDIKQFGDLCPHHDKLGVLVKPHSPNPKMLAREIAEMREARKKHQDEQRHHDNRLDTRTEQYCATPLFEPDTKTPQIKEPHTKAISDIVPAKRYETIWVREKKLVGSRKVYRTIYVNRVTPKYYPCRDPNMPAFSIVFAPVRETVRYFEDIPVFQYVKVPVFRQVGVIEGTERVVSSTTVRTKAERRRSLDRALQERELRRAYRWLQEREMSDPIPA